MPERPTRNQGQDAVSVRDLSSDLSYLSTMKVVLAGYLAIHELERICDYLLPKVHRLAFIGLVTFEASGVAPVVALYENAKLVRKIELPFRLKPPHFLYTFLLFISYCMHLVAVLLLTISYVGISDLFVGVSYTPALAGSLLRTIGLTRSFIYYSYDYAPTPPDADFFTAVSSRLFQALDSKCARSADITWNLTNAMRLARKTVSKDRLPESDIVVPYSLIPYTGHSAGRRKNTAAFIGNLRDGQGVELAIDAVPFVLKRVPKFRLLIIGTGPREQELRAYVNSRKLHGHVSFLGFIGNKRIVQGILSSCSLGLAPYFPDPYSLVNYAYPGKVKTYLECGLPVIMTDVADISKQIRTQKAGFVIDYDAKQLAESVVKILTNKQLSDDLRRNVTALTARSKPQTLLHRAFALSRNRILTARARR